jgi:hypothetical protein
VDVAISDCRLLATDFQYWGAKITSSDVRFENTVFEACHYHWLEAGPKCRVVLLGCQFLFNRYSAVRVESDSVMRAVGNLFRANEGAAIELAKGVRSEIVGNTIVYNRKGGIAAEGDVQLDMHHNTLVGNGSSALHMKRMVSGKIHDNIFVGNELGLGSAEREYVELALHHNLFWRNTRGDYGNGFAPGEGDIEQDPLFAHVANGDFRLSGGSPALGAGTSSSNIGAWNSVDSPVRSEWGLPPRSGAWHSGRRVLVVRPTSQADAATRGDPLARAKWLARELSEQRSDKAAVERLGRQLEQVARELSPGSDLLRNSDLESGDGELPASWQFRDEHLIQWRWAAGLGHGGSKGLYVKKAEGMFPYASFVGTIAGPQEDALVRVSAKIKTADVTKAVLDLVFLDARGEWIYHIWIEPIGRSWGSDTHDWKDYVGYAYVPRGTARIEVSLQMYGPGELWLDDYQCRLMGQ